MTRIMQHVLASMTVVALATTLAPKAARADDSTEPDERSEPSEPRRRGEIVPRSEPPVSIPGVSHTPAAPEPRSQRTDDYYWVDDGSRPPLPYRDGVAVPRGYRVDSHPSMGLLVAGITITGTLWTVSTIAAIALDQRQSTDEGDPNFDDAYWPMFIPVVGPFITIKTADSSGTGAAILGLNGVVQAGGIGLMIAGIAAPKVEIIPQRPITIAPIASADAVGLDISGAF